MTLKKEDRDILVTLRMQRAKELLVETKELMAMGYWRTIANRLYYACFHAVSALLLKNGYTAHTHSGVITQFGLHFVTKGIISMEQGKFYRNLFEKRQTGDYDVWISIDEQDIIPLLEPAQKFIEDIENLIINTPKDMT